MDSEASFDQLPFSGSISRLKMTDSFSVVVMVLPGSSGLAQDILLGEARRLKQEPRELSHFLEQIEA
jgi:hypothetical protein